MLSKSYQSNTFYNAQLGRQKQFYLTKIKSPHSPSQACGKGKKYI